MSNIDSLRVFKKEKGNKGQLTYNNEVIDDFKNKLVETFQKYKNKATNLKQDINDEKEWSLPNGSYDEKDSGEECDEECEEEEELDDEDN